MKILLTAFDPFGEDTVNPALEAVKCVNPDNVPAELVKLEVPTVFYRSLEVVRDAIDKEQPDVVLAIGQAGGRFGLTPERVAINQDDARITDNDGGQPIDTPVVEGGPAAYFATIPIKAMVQAMQDAGLPAQISNSAGTFVCNHLMYGILHALAEDGRGARGGFMHVPFIPEQVTTRKDTASMALADITRGIEVALTASVENATDIKVQGGAIS